MRTHMLSVRRSGRRQTTVTAVVALLAMLVLATTAGAQTAPMHAARPAPHDGHPLPVVSGSGAHPLSVAGRRAVGELVAEMSATREVARGLGTQTARTPRRSWAARHPVLLGSLVGFGTGFLIGYLPGDDGLFYDFTAEFNGMVMGGIGAGTGAAIGAIVDASRK